MFWGLILKNNKKYSQTVSKAFHLSQVVLDTSTCGDDPVQVMLTSETITYVLCNLKKGKVEQWNLDLNFAEGDKITLFTKGEGAVHLSGYLIPDELDMMGDEEMDMEDEDEEVEAPKLENGSKKERVAKKVAEKIISKEVKEIESEEEIDETFDAATAAKEAAEVSEDSDDDDESGDEDDDNEEQANGEEEDSDDSEDDDDDDEEDDSDDEVEQPKAKVAKLEPTKSKQNGAEMNGKSVEKKEKKENASPKVKSLPGGLMVEDLKVGVGKEATNGKKLAVFYEGRLKKSGKVFDSTARGQPFKFFLGRGEVIKAWDVGVTGMKVGGKRRLVCPPNMAYGNKGSPPVIPPNSTLVFDVELKNVF